MTNNEKIFCAYCKNEIISTENLEICGSAVYHKSCLEQKQCHIDAFGDEEDLGDFLN